MGRLVSRILGGMPQCKYQGTSLSEPLMDATDSLVWSLSLSLRGMSLLGLSKSR